MKHIVQFSGGAASTYVGWLVAREFGRENTILLNHDPGAEHPDTKRFLRQASEYIGVPITQADDGRDLWEVIKDENCLPSHFIPFCTRILKLEPGEKFLKELDESYILYNGLGPEEFGRVQRSIVRGEAQGRTVRCLLAERNITSAECKRIIRDEWKICLPEPYLYLSHNNCIPCWKAGKGHFYQVWKYYPEQFWRAAKLEESIGFIQFKDMTLYELAEKWKREDINQELDFGDEDGRPCMCAS